jgi:hypothetical protein
MIGTKACFSTLHCGVRRPAPARVFGGGTKNHCGHAPVLAVERAADSLQATEQPAAYAGPILRRSDSPAPSNSTAVPADRRSSAPGGKLNCIRELVMSVLIKLASALFGKCERHD